MHAFHSVRSLLFSAPLLIALSSCGEDYDTSRLAEVPQGFGEEEAEDEAQPESAAELMDSFASIQQAPPAWNQVILQSVRKDISRLEEAKDKSVFCPGYESATLEQREACWARLVKATIRYESTFDPKLTFKEPNGAMSVGLLMLSPGECPEAKTEEQLKNPEKNIHCGMAKMARLISRDNMIAGTGTRKGAAAYWSVLRKPYKYGKYKLGKQNEIIALTKGYKVAAN